jgi:hypothetical protein
MMAHSPADLFFEWLKERPAAARVAIAIDSDRLLTDAGLWGKERLTDKTGREWRLVVFRGDDIAFRKSYRHVRAEKHVLMVLTRGAETQNRIHVTHISDILAANEGGPPFDGSLPAVFRKLCPQINFPVAELRRFKDVLLERLDSVGAAAKKIIERWGRPDDWGRAQVAALVLLVRHSEWVLNEIWPDELEPGAAVAHALRVLLSVPAESSDLPIILELLPEAIRPQVKPHLFWLDQPADQLAAFLLIRKFAADTKLQNPLVQIKGLHVFPLEFPLDSLEPLSERVVAAAQAHPNGWRLVERRAEDFITPGRAGKLASLIAEGAHSTEIAALSSPALLLPFLEARLAESLANTSPDAFECMETLQTSAALTSDEVIQTERRQQCRTLVRLATCLRRAESVIAAPTPNFAHVEQLLDWYINSGHYLLELDIARALHDQQEIQREDLSHAAGHYLLGGDDEEAPNAGSLLHRVRLRLDELDRNFAELVSAAPDKFQNSPRSFVSFIKEELAGEVQQILSGQSPKHVWVLIFDGMRYDTWEAVVQPLLGEHFTITGSARFCTLPSYTLYARRSVLAGAPPAAWVTGKRAASRTEESLFADNLGLAKNETKEKLRLLSDADTNKARTKSNYKESQPRPFNVLIYPISDECHEYRGDLAAFNDKIRLEIVGNKDTGVRGILDDLLRRVKPGDIVLATSDHGFIELPPASAVVVGQSGTTELSDSIFYRYAMGHAPSALKDSVSVEVAGERHALCVGRTWLKREGTAQMARYSHGGVSLAEMVVPAARLMRVTEKVIAIELRDFPQTITVDEDSSAEVAFALKNSGNVDAVFELSARDSLDRELLKESGQLAPAGGRALKLSVLGTYRTRPDGEVDAKATLLAITIRLRYKDQSGQWRDARDGIGNIPVKVHPKKTKLGTDALSGFDDV